MSRKNFTKATLVARFKYCGGRCEWIEAATGMRCETVLVPGRWHGDHANPDGLTGEPTFENCRCLCLYHHAIKTKGDRADIDQAKRREAFAVGVPKEIGPDRPIHGKPLPTTKKAAARAAREPKPSLPPRILFVDIPEQVK